MERVWQGNPADASGALASIASEFGSNPSSPVVFFQSPTSVSGLFSCPMQVRDITSAARMSLSEMASFEIESNAWSVQPIDRDRNGPKRRHVVVSAETDESLRHLRQLCERSGMPDAILVPIEAALLSRAVDTAIAHSKTEEPLISVFFGQSKSVIVAAHRQRLLLVRQVDFGTDRLIDALAAAIEGTNPENAHDLAERLLFQFGLPKAGDTCDVDGRSFSASDILPAIQPALQRLVVEVRQSIRFGLADSDRSPGILIAGSGASIPRLHEAFGTELGCSCFADNSCQPEANLDVAHAADAWNHGLRISLREREFTATAARNALRNALYAGSAAAILIGAGAATLLSEPSAPASPPDGTALAPPSSAPGFDPELASRRAAAVRATIRAVSNSTGDQADAGAVLREICILASDKAILTDIEITTDAEASKCTLRGYMQGESTETAERLRALIDRFRRSPLIASVRLESTQNSVLDEQNALYFSAVLEFTNAPAGALQPNASLADASTWRSD
jgi:Tfp pilus assembly PilM family ATPase